MLHNTNELLLSVVIINFRTPKLTTNCLFTLLPELKEIDARVVVIDNHSEDGSSMLIKEWLAEHDKDSKVLFIQSDTNSGFSAGNNLGIKALNAKYYLLLNSDTLIRPGAIQSILNTIALFPKAGLVSPRLEWLDGTGQESCFRYPTLFSEFIAAAQTGFIDRLLNSHVVAMPVQTQLATPEWTSFACVLIRHEVFQQVGLMDEGYFMYFEDAEFCHRAARVGWVTIHNPKAWVVHLRGGSSPVKRNSIQKKRLPKYFYESRSRFFYQTHGWMYLLTANLMWWLGRMVSKTRQFLGRRDKAAIERQWTDIWSNCLDPLKKYTHPGS